MNYNKMVKNPRLTGESNNDEYARQGISAELIVQMCLFNSGKTRFGRMGDMMKDRTLD